jgi:adenylate cyclase
MAGKPARSPWRGVPVALLGAAIAFVASLVGLFGPAERLFHDARLLLREPLDSESAVVAITTESVSREHLARLVTQCASAEAIGIDVLFLDRTPDDAAFAEALGDAGQVALSYRFERTLTEQEDPARADWLLPGPLPIPERRRRIREYASVLAPNAELGRASALTGHVNVTLDPDGKVRSLPLLIAHRGRLFPSLALSLCLRAHGREPSDLRLGRRSIEFDDRDGNPVRIPVDRDWRMMIGYDRELDQVGGLWHPKVLGEGTIVLIGRTGGAGNLLSTPLWPAIEGVYVHAAALDDLLSGRFIHRPGRPWELLVIILFTVVTGLLTASTRPWLAAALTLLWSTAPFLIGHFALVRWGWMLPVAAPTFAILSGGALVGAGRLVARRERRLRTARIFLDGLPEATLRRLDAASLGGITTREVSLLLARPPALEADADQALRRFFEVVRREVLDHDGALIELSAERVVALFNAPLTLADHAGAAAATAVSIKEELEPTAALHLGEVRLGVVGSHRHERFVVFGEPLEEAGRLLGRAGAGRTVMSEAFAQRIGKRFEGIEVDAGFASA